MNHFLYQKSSDRSVFGIYNCPNMWENLHSLIWKGKVHEKLTLTWSPLACRPERLKVATLPCMLLSPDRCLTGVGDDSWRSNAPRIPPPEKHREFVDYHQIRLLVSSKYLLYYFRKIIHLVWLAFPQISTRFMKILRKGRTEFYLFVGLVWSWLQHLEVFPLIAPPCLSLEGGAIVVHLVGMLRDFLNEILYQFIFLYCHFLKRLNNSNSYSPRYRVFLNVVHCVGRGRATQHCTNYTAVVPLMSWVTFT